MQLRQLRQVDTTTGEVLEGGLVYFPVRAKIRGGWFMTFQDPLAALACDGSLTQSQWRVMAFLMSKLDFENYIYISQVEVGKALRIKPPHVSAAVSALVKRGVVLRGPKVGVVQTYRLSHNLGWKGRVKNLETERKKRLQVVPKGGLPEDGQQGKE